MTITSSYAQTPSGLDRLSFWYDASQGVTLGTDSNVLYWNNMANASDTAYQTDVLKQPKLIAFDSLLNNQPVIYFDGAGDQLLDTNILNMGAIYVIARWSGNDTVFPESSGIMARLGSAPFINVLNGLSGTSNLQTTSNPWGATGLFINQQNTANFSPLTTFKLMYGQRTNSVAYNGVKIGSSNSNSFKFWEGGIAEIIGFDTIPSDSVQNIVHAYLMNKYSPPVDLGVNIVSTNFCDIILRVDDRFKDYLWLDGSSEDSLAVNKTGWYSVTVTDMFGYVSTDSIFVQFPDINQIVEDTICQGDSKLWTTNLDTTLFNFEWSNGLTDSLINIIQEDDYWVKVTDSLGCFQYSDTIVISVDSFPTQTTLGIDKTVC